MTKSEFIKAYKDYYNTETGLERSTASVERDFKIFESFLKNMIANGESVSLVGLGNLTYKTREAGEKTIAGKKYILPKTIKPVFKFSKSLSATDCSNN